MKSLANIGWIKIHRTIYDDELWQVEKPFDLRSAWIDIILMANHEDKEIIVGTQALLVRRGQKFTSIRKLALRWRWSEKKVSRFLELLVSTGKIYKDATHNGTLLTIIKYDFYQGNGNTNDYMDNHANNHSGDTQATTPMTDKQEYKNNKNNKRKKEIDPAPPYGGGEWQ